MIYSKVSDALITTLGSWGIWSAIFATIFVIGMGYLLAFKGIFKAEWEKVLIKIVMLVGLPALALSGFLVQNADSDITLDNLKGELVVIIIGFAFYAIMSISSKIFFLKYEKDIKDTLAMCIAFASTTFFGIPVVTALFEGTEANASKLTTNVFNVPYRVFLYSFAFIVMSKKPLIVTKKRKDMNEVEVIENKKIRKQTLKNIFCNPILICTFIGLFIWSTQLIPGIRCLDLGRTMTSTMSNGSKVKEKVLDSPLRFDLLFPPSFKIISTLQTICTPLAWLAIGMTMNKGNLKEAIKDKTVWYASVIKVLVAPLIILLFVMVFAFIGYQTGWFKLTNIQLVSLVILTASPPANVVVAYSISYQKGANLSSNLTTLSTLLSVITLPIWVVVVTAISVLPIFGVVT